MQGFWRRFRRNRAAVFGLFILVGVVGLALIAPFLYSQSPYRVVTKPFLPPFGEYITGTDVLGRDVSARIAHGARTSLLIGILATVMAVVVGTLVGGFAGYYGGLTDDILMRITEFFQTIPSFIFAIVLVAILKPSIESIIIAVGDSSSITVAPNNDSAFSVRVSSQTVIINQPINAEIDDYKSIMQKAWQQVGQADTPEVQSQLYDKNLEWTMLDKDYDDRTRRVFRGPVFVPMWWGRYDPTFPKSAPVSTGRSTSSSMPSVPNLPGSDFASSVAVGMQTFSQKVIGNVTDFTSRVTNVTTRLPLLRKTREVAQPAAADVPAPARVPVPVAPVPVRVEDVKQG